MSEKDNSKHGERLTIKSRALWLRSLDIVTERGKSPAEILADQYEANPLSFLEKMARYLPKDVNVNHAQQGLQELVAGLERLRQQAAQEVVVQRSSDVQDEQPLVKH